MLFLCFLAACAPVRFGMNVPKQELALNSVVSFGQTPIYGGPVDQSCAGFVYHGRVVTAQHCLRQVNNRFHYMLRQDVLWSPLHVDCLSNRRDVAFLSPTSSTLGPGVNFARSWTSEEPVYAIGHPYHRMYVVTYGNLLYKDTRGGREMLISSSRVRPGNSGGPLLNAYGQVLGMAVAYRGRLESLHLPYWEIQREYQSCFGAGQ